jgi:hypothetical protein
MSWRSHIRLGATVLNWGSEHLNNTATWLNGWQAEHSEIAPRHRRSISSRKNGYCAFARRKMLHGTAAKAKELT